MVSFYLFFFSIILQLGRIKRSRVRNVTGLHRNLNWIGVNTFHYFVSGKQRFFYTIRNQNLSHLRK